MNIHLYTDGGLRPDARFPAGQGYGGTGFVAVDDAGVVLFEGSTHYPSAVTNQQMELLAAIEGLQQVTQHTRERPGLVVLYSDSAYMLNCHLQNWWFNWITKSNWRNSANKPVENQSLWRSLLGLSDHAARHYVSRFGPISERSLSHVSKADAEVLVNSSRALNVSFVKVKGHSTNVLNNRADELATKGKNGLTFLSGAEKAA